MDEATGPPAGNPIREFGLLYSRFCNAACAHCGSSSGPTARGRMPMDIVERCVTDVAGAGIRSVMISGGEPLAYFTDIRHVAGLAQTAGLGVQLCSNGFWGDRRDRALSWLEQLRDRGLDELLLSTDRFHLAFVPLRSVIGAAQAASELGIPCQIAVPATARDWQASSIVATLQRETDALVRTHPVHPVGRGEGLPPHHFRWPTLQVGPCHLVGHVEVDQDGTVSVCPTSADFDQRSPLILGNVTADPLATLLTRFQATPLYAVISRWGPLGLHVLANGTRDTGMLGLPERLHDCHLCRSLTTDETVAARVADRHGVDLLAPVAPTELAGLLQQVAEAIAVDAARRDPPTHPAPPRSAADLLPLSPPS
ncbi:MAG: radical SAM protein [Nitriliruptoraceae bacterium]